MAMRRLPALLVAATLIVGFVGPGAVAAGVPDAEITTKNSTNFLTPLALLPIKIPVAQAGPITFQNIEEHISEISLAAYEEVQNTLNRNEQPVTKKRIHIGPNTETNVPDVDGAFNKIIKYWSGFRQPATYDALIFSFEDKAWALKKAATIPSVIKSGGVRGFTGIYDQIMGCIAPRQCSDTNSSIVYKAERSALGFFGMDPVLTAGDPYLRNGGVQGSMYTAAVQQSQFLDFIIYGN